MTPFSRYSCVTLLGLLLLLGSVCHAQKVVKLGFLLPYPEGDSAVPQRLADEWISAVRVAMEVLAPDYESAFTVEPFVKNSRCNSTAAAAAAQELVDGGVMGVVGPACSEAVAGANTVFKKAGMPYVSFAATANAFADDVAFPTFFRTVYADQHQARAMLSVIKYFNFKHVNLFHSAELYGRALSGDLKRALGDAATQIEIAYPGTDNPADYEPYFDGVKNGEGIINVFVTLPNVAENLWKAAYNLNYTKFPWWYLGSDGAVAFDLVTDGDELNHLTHALQGEIGVAPYKGNYHPRTSPFVRFMDFWKEKSHETYPGLLSLDVSPRYTEARAYVTNLVDAIWAFYEAFNHIITVNKDDVTTPAIVDCFKDKPSGCLRFDGASGTMSFNNVTGERDSEAQTPEYGFYNLIDQTWKEKSKWVLNKKEGINPNLEYMLRPGPLPAGWRDNLTHQREAPQAIIPKMSEIGAATYNDIQAAKNVESASSSSSSSGGGGSSGANTGAIVALVLVLLIVVCFLAYGAFFLYKRYKRHPEHQQFVRML
ncbi:hypothetical protein CLOM_g374 [Closterium sp. NIES-68]|nr:hypothetical protein CLOM_g374 [Closterium sp. NIES-68]GJP83627.1 hypothetical protein CLOP_g13755 [Closterium sp. NIES-67]